MKKNDWLLLFAVALYSFLFYDQYAGINWLMFSIALILFLIIRDKNLLKSKQWILISLCTVISSACIMFYSSGFALVTSIISLMLLSAFSINHRSSVFTGILASVFSIMSVPYFMLKDFFERRKKITGAKQEVSAAKFFIYVIPFFISFIFFWIYANSSFLFSGFLDTINLDFVNFPWLFFTISGLILMYAFFYSRKLNFLSSIDESSTQLIEREFPSIHISGKVLMIKDEIKSGIMLFSMLNILLLIYNFLDARFLTGNTSLPPNVSYTQYVHQGTGMLIFSILIAIAIILFFFRGAINFYSNIKAIKLLAYIWIIQNMFMLISTMYRNNLYIIEYGLTYKKIGVYVYLLLTFVGLVVTFIKILKLKTNNFLFRANGWSFYFTMLFLSVVNWDLVIADYNINRAKNFEPGYLYLLSSDVLPQLITLQNNNPDKFKNAFYLDSNPRRNYGKIISDDLYDFLEFKRDLNWQSYCFAYPKTYDEIINLNRAKQIKRIDLAHRSLSTISELFPLNNISEFNLPSNNLKDLKEFKIFNSVKKIDLFNNKITSLSGIESLTDLIYLNINGNPIIDYSPLYNLKNLKTLFVDVSITDEEFMILLEHLPSTNIIREKAPLVEEGR